ncbi:MAG: hypothetical protein AAF329_16640 [Cyanobacteria bacterium P01_A01_bin.17]
MEMTAPKIRHSNVEAFMDKAMTPKGYCAEWVPKLYGVSSEERGYRLLCAKELARITGYKVGSIQNWGADFAKAPKAARRICAMASVLNQTSTDWSAFVKDQSAVTLRTKRGI